MHCKLEQVAYLHRTVCVYICWHYAPYDGLPFLFYCCRFPGSFFQNLLLCLFFHIFVVLYTHTIHNDIAERNSRPNTFFMDSGTLDNYSTDLTHPHTHQMSRKPNMRRYDTLDVFSIGAYEIRKANSFNANDSQVAVAADDTMSRRTSSMRHGSATMYPYEIGDDIDPNAMTVPVAHMVAEATGANRRNCRMHKSFHERSRHHDINRIEKAIDSKCYSLGDDGSDDNLSVANARRLSPKFNSAQSSLENEVFHMHSRSSSRNKIESGGGESIDMIEATSPSSATSMAAAAVAISAFSKKPHQNVPHKHSSQSLDKPNRSFRRIARATQSFYMAPTQMAGDQQMAYGAHGPNAALQKRMHSVSMRTKPFRDGMNDAYMSGDMSPQRHDSISDVKKSPRLSSSGYELQKPARFDVDGSDQDAAMRGRPITLPKETNNQIPNQKSRRIENTLHTPIGLGVFVC